LAEQGGSEAWSDVICEAFGFRAQNVQGTVRIEHLRYAFEGLPLFSD